MLVGRVRRSIETRGLIPRGVRVLCACSGGPDSAALLYCLAKLQRELGFELIAGSVDHGLRPDAARDVAIASEQAARVAVPFHRLKVRVEAGSSIQAQARKARYEALQELAARLGASRIAVGHTQDDQAETVLSRLLRGSGLPGLGAIRPLREDGVVRPLIDCRRADVHRLAATRFERVAQDMSNRDPKFERVRIRSHILPALLVEDAALIRHLAQLADDARDCELALEALSETLIGQLTVDTRTLVASALRGQPRAIRVSVLRRFVVRATGQLPGRAELTQLDRTLCSDRGEVWLAAGASVRASGDGHLRVCTRGRQGGGDG
ncbi:MAG TPA: tRNA lysidine(34) synthetase TilS [Polyangiales bacterium]|jgi:tRNA(Ile)-lysidine synthase|nr:tRNA lysidine(34) synthetase TilS [Polyangiales bacterium]